MNTSNKLYPIDQVIALINSGNQLVLAGNEDAIKKLPKGNWIGGSIPYFMDTDGGCFNDKLIFVTDFTEISKNSKICVYNQNQIEQIMNDRFENGFGYILIPCFSEILTKYAMISQSLSSLYDSPLIGWVTGIDLNKIGEMVPKIFNGIDGKEYENEAIVMHIEMPENKTAAIEIINIFEQGNGDSIMFEKDGFEFKECLVNGQKRDIVQYVKENNIDIRLPLVADYSGAMINVSFQQVNEEKNTVLFYAPLIKGVEYKLAKPVENYVAAFQAVVPKDVEVVSSCNCILNYLYSELEGKKTGQMRGPFTFGEIAYVLVNQTLVYLKIL